jgi:hypothetical protein
MRYIASYLGVITIRRYVRLPQFYFLCWTFFEVKAQEQREYLGWKILHETRRSSISRFTVQIHAHYHLIKYTQYHQSATSPHLSSPLLTLPTFRVFALGACGVAQHVDFPTL